MTLTVRTIALSLGDSMEYIDFRDGIRQAVTGVLDAHVRKITNNPEIYGWVDSELEVLMSGLDKHVDALAKRINEAHAKGETALHVELEG